MKKFTKLFLTFALLFGVMGGVNSVKAYTVTTKTPILLTGGKFAECFTSGTYYIQMDGWQNFTVYEDAIGVAFDENSTMVFDMAEQSNSGEVRVVFTFSDATTVECWWCLGIGASADDETLQYYHKLDNSVFWLKKGLGANFEDKKTLNITKVTVNNQNFEGGIYKINGGTICGQSMTIKKAGQWYDPTVFGAYGGVFSATTAQTNIFKMESVDVSDYQKIVIKFGAAVPSTGNWAYNYQSGVYPPSIPVDATELEIPLDGTTLPELTIFNWNADPDPINISEVYFYKEEEEYATLDFNVCGATTVDKKYLTATDGLSYNNETGVLSSDGTAGTMVLDFDSPVDLKYLKSFEVSRSGGNDNIISRLEFYDEDNEKINTWNGNKLANGGLDNNATNAFLSHKPVKKMVWQSDANVDNNGKSFTISGIKFQLKTMTCLAAGETQLNTLPWNIIDNSGTATPDWNMYDTNDTYYGNYSGDATHYADLTDYSELRVYCTSNATGFRCFFIKSDKSGTNQVNSSAVAATWHSEGGYYSLDLSAIEKWDGKVALKAIKSESGKQRFVTNIVVYKTPDANAPVYKLSGSGMQVTAAVAALADASATCIDATDVTGITTNSEAGRTLLTSANPNCLFLGTTGDGHLANTQNVIDGSTCANLVLTDGKPFKALSDFTATAASYTTTINTTAKAGTLCLPFAATIPGGVNAWTLEYTTGDAATATPVVTTIPANTPVLLNGSGETTFTGSGAVSASATNTASQMTGVFQATYAPLNSYVLQNGAEGLGFYHVDAANTIEVNPFRAYLTAGSGARSLGIIYADETNGINNATRMSEENAVYNLQGVRVAQPTKGLYIVNGKKMMVK